MQIDVEQSPASYLLGFSLLFLGPQILWVRTFPPFGHLKGISTAPVTCPLGFSGFLSWGKTNTHPMIQLCLLAVSLFFVNCCMATGTSARLDCGKHISPKGELQVSPGPTCEEQSIGIRHVAVDKNKSPPWAAGLLSTRIWMCGSKLSHQNMDCRFQSMFPFARATHVGVALFLTTTAM